MSVFLSNFSCRRSYLFFFYPLFLIKVIFLSLRDGRKIKERPITINCYLENSMKIWFWGFSANKLTKYRNILCPKARFPQFYFKWLNYKPYPDICVSHPKSYPHNQSSCLHPTCSSLVLWCIEQSKLLYPSRKGPQLRFRPWWTCNPNKK